MRVLLLLVVVVLVAAYESHVRSTLKVDDAFPRPFSRTLELEQPPMEGPDVYILQNLLLRSHQGNHLQLTSKFDLDTSIAVTRFQAGNGIPSSGVVDPQTARLLLQMHMEDNYKDDNLPLPAGFLYKIYVPVYRNRSIETTATLFDAKLSVLHQFTARTHGQNDPNTGEALNQLTGDGSTPTGLSTVDLNSPEDDPSSFGPYPVNRFVQGLKGNQFIVISDIRDGILMHTGEWPNWNTTMPMPNSHGCVHAHPEDIQTVWLILTNQLGVVVHNNTFGKLPYPYVPQGLVSIECQDCHNE